MDGPSNIPNSGPTIDMVRWKNSDRSLEAAPTVEGCWSSHVLRDQPLSKPIMCGNARAALSHYTKGSENMARSAWSRKNAAQCADKWRQFIKDNCDDGDAPKVNTPLVQTKVTNTAVTASAFWTTTPFQIMGTMQQLDQSVTEINKQIGSYIRPVDTQFVGAVAFVGLTIGAFYQLRFGNTAPLEKLVGSFK